jgi:hypothetical protein
MFKMLRINYFNKTAIHKKRKNNVIRQKRTASGCKNSQCIKECRVLLEKTGLLLVEILKELKVF